MDNNLCKNCKYYRISEEYWHDHYRIPEHYFCIKNNRYGDEIDKDKKACAEFELWEDND